MIASILALTTAAAALTPVEAKFDQCVALINKSTEKAIEFAGQWQIDDGGVPAGMCLGLAYAAEARWLPAMTAFEQAARLAERKRDSRAANLWVQSGNAALAGGQPAKARIAFETALATGQIKGVEAGEIWLDRARALVMLRDMPAARTSLDEALKLAPQDPLAWLLSATLARRMADLKRAETDIAQALKLAPDDASVALEAGNIALANGAPAAAKLAWEAAVRLAPASPAGKSAAQALTQFSTAPAR